MNSTCSCGSAKDYLLCCGAYHKGKTAESPELLMRSRYSAYVYGLKDYLLCTWHSSTRPTSLPMDNSPKWCALNILGSSLANDTAIVHFKALYKEGLIWHFLEEHSNFVMEGGKWFYLDGKVSEGVLKPGRNDSCPCGSGKKYKRCCFNDGSN